MNFKAIIKSIFYLSFIIGLIPLQTYSQDMAVPAKLQAALFKKIFSFDKTLKSEGISIAIISADGSGGDVEKEFKAAGFTVNVISGSTIPSDATVAYRMPGAPSVKSGTAGQSVLSISGVTSYVESGEVAVGLGVEGGKPKIIINHAQLTAEKHEIAGGLLSLAKIIR